MRLLQFGPGSKRLLDAFLLLWLLNLLFVGPLALFVYRDRSYSACV
jgi:hypothetical protein